MPLSENYRNAILKMSPAAQQAAGKILAQKKAAAEKNSPGFFSSVGKGLAGIGHAISDGYKRRSTVGFSDVKVNRNTSGIKKFGLGVVGGIEGFFDKTGFTEASNKFDEARRKANPNNTFMGNLGVGGKVAWNAAKGIPERVINTGQTAFDIGAMPFRNDGEEYIADIKRAKNKKSIEKFFYGDKTDAIEGAGRFIGGEATTAAASFGLGEAIGGGGRVAMALKTAGVEGGLEYLGTESKESALTAALLAGAGGFFAKPIGGGKFAKNLGKISSKEAKLLEKEVVKSGKTGFSNMFKKRLSKRAARDVFEGELIPKLKSSKNASQIAKELEIPAFQRQKSKLDLEDALKNFDERISGLKTEKQLALPEPKKFEPDFVGAPEGKLFDLRKSSVDISDKIKTGLKRNFDEISVEVKSLSKKGAKRTAAENVRFSSLKSRLRNIEKNLLDEVGIQKLTKHAENLFEKISSGKPVAGLEAGKFAKIIDLLDGKIDIPSGSANFTKRVSKFLSQPEAARINKILSGQTKLAPEQAIAELSSIINGASKKSSRFSELSDLYTKTGALDDASSVELRQLQDEMLNADLPHNPAENAVKNASVEELLDTPYSKLDGGEIDSIPEKIMENPESFESISRKYGTTDPMDVPGKKLQKEKVQEIVKTGDEDIMSRQMGSLKYWANAYTSTADGIMRAFPEKIAHGLQDFVANFHELTDKLIYRAQKPLSSVRKIPKEIQEEAMLAIKEGRIDELSGDALRFAQSAKETLDYLGKTAVRKGVQRLDGGTVQLLDNFFPDVSVNYSMLRGAKKKAIIEKTAKLNSLSFDEAKKLLDLEFLGKSKGDQVYYAGSFAYRRNPSNLELPKADLTPLEMMDIYIDATANHIGKVEAFGLTPVTKNGQPLGQIRDSLEDKIFAKRQELAELGEAGSEVLEKQIQKLQSKLDGLQGKYKFKHLDDFIDNEIARESERELARSAVRAHIGEKAGKYHEFMKQARIGDKGMMSRVAVAAETAGRVSGDLATAIVSTPKGVLYDAGNILRSVIAHREGVFKGALQVAFKKDSRKMFKMGRDLGMFDSRNQILRAPNEEIFGKLLDVTLKPLEFTQSVSAKFNMVAAHGRASTLIKRARKGKLSIADISELREEFGLGTKQIDNLENASLEDIARMSINNTYITVMAKRGAKHVAGNEYGVIAKNFFKFYPYQLTATAQLIRNLKRRPLTTAAVAAPIGLGAGLGLKSLEKAETDPNASQLERYTNALINPDRKKLASESELYEHLWNGIEVMYGLDYFLSKTISTHPLDKNDPLYERTFGERFFTQLAGSYGINLNQTLAIRRGIKQTLKDGYVSDRAARSFSYPIGVTRDVVKFNQSADAKKITETRSVDELTDLLYKRQIDNDFLDELNVDQKKQFLKRMTVLDGVTYGLNSTQFQVAMERYQEARPKAKKATIVKSVWKQQAKDEGLSYEAWMFNKIEKNPDPIEFIKTLAKQGFLGKKELEYIRDRGIKN